MDQRDVGERESAGETLRRLREERDLSQEELALMVGVSLGSVSHWETGRHAPKRAAAMKIDDQLSAGGELLRAYGYSVASGARPTTQHPPGMVDVSEFDERLERIEQRQAAILEQLKAEQLRVEQLLSKMTGGNTNGGGNERGPRDGLATDSDPGRPGGRRDRGADQVPSEDRGV